MSYRSSNKRLYSAKYHIIWCLKYRARVLATAVETRLPEIIIGVVAEVGGQVIEVEVMVDHVHLLVEAPPVVALSTLVQLVKRRSSHLLPKQFPSWHRAPMAALWSLSWFVSSVGGAPLEVVRRYGQNHKTAA